MAQGRLTVRKIKEILRYYFSGISSSRKIGLSIGVSKSAVGSCISKALLAGIKSINEVSAYSDIELEQLLYPSAKEPDKGVSTGKGSKVLPDWNYIRHELGRKHVTLALLWTEYKADNPSGYEYSQFCELYRRWNKKFATSMRQVHKAGEKAFVDFCDGHDVLDINTGEARETDLFVGTLGASSYVYARAVFTQDEENWIDCHCKMYSYFGGVPEITVPDNLKSGVTESDRYEPLVNASYQDMSEHYGTCIIPARVRKPRDKAKVEASVLVAQRWILASLRDKVFTNLYDLNVAIDELLSKLNNKVMRHVGKSRKELYETIDRPMLKQLPSTTYEYTRFKKVKVNIDCHISLDGSYYSAPYQYVHEELWCKYRSLVIELYSNGKRVASHIRSFKKGAYVTNKEHLPKSYREHLEWTPSRIISWGATLGENVGLFIEKLISEKRHPEQGYRASLGVIRLAKKYDNDRLNKACGKALSIDSISYKTIEMILKKNMEGVPLPKTLDLFTATENLRGSAYYQ